MNNLTAILIILFILKLFINNANTSYNRTGIVESEARLLKSIFNNYNKKLRPADTVEIKFSLYLNQIITLIEQEQIIVLNVFLDHEWIDGRILYFLL
jgi:hypothetical protein